MAVTNAQFANVVKEQTGKATLLTPVFLAQFASTFDGNPNDASALSSDVGEQIVAAANDGVFWQGSYAAGLRMVKQNGIWVVDGEGLAQAKADAARDAAIDEAQARIDAAKLGRAYKGEIDSSVVTLAETGSPTANATVLVYADGTNSGSYIGDGTNWNRMANAALNSTADGALWYDKATKQLRAVEGDGVVFGDDLTIGIASPVLEVSGSGAIDVINGLVSIRTTELEEGGSNALDAGKLGVSFTGEVVSSTTNLVTLLTSIDDGLKEALGKRNKSLMITIDKTALESHTSGTLTISATIPSESSYDAAGDASLRIYGGTELIPDEEYTFSVAGSTVSIVLAETYVNQIKNPAETYKGKLTLSVKPA